MAQKSPFFPTVGYPWLQCEKQPKKLGQYLGKKRKKKVFLWIWKRLEKSLFLWCYIGNNRHLGAQKIKVFSMSNLQSWRSSPLNSSRVVVRKAIKFPKILSLCVRIFDFLVSLIRFVTSLAMESDNVTCKEDPSKMEAAAEREKKKDFYVRSLLLQKQTQMWKRLRETSLFVGLLSTEIGHFECC